MKKAGRHELKHRISYADYLQLHAQLSCTARPDENALSDNHYRVRSLYFDNYSDKALMEKINGINEREKFRLRFYNDDISFIRLEKKSKVNGLCYKNSTGISAEECTELLNGNYNVLKANGSLLMLELYSKIHYQQLRPKNIVDYMREAYIFPAGNVRVTIDKDIRSSANVNRFLDPELVTIPIPRTIILEVKYDAFLPELIRNIVSLQSRQAAPFSKYAVTRMA